MSKYNFLPADILLPEKDFEKYAVIACDQFTSDESYWEETKENAGTSVSALNLVLPEIYLGKNEEERIDSINKTMKKYLENGSLQKIENSMIYVERETSGGTRRGIVGLIRLSDYDYRKGSRALIRATEETVLERIPPRVRIRKDAPMELPHVMLLIDDPEKTVIEPLESEKTALKLAYDFDLMQNGGNIKGYILDGSYPETIGESLNKLLEKNEFLFAVGDGNHSLATAKECSALSDNEKAKYALVEIVNIHDESLQFEPIYRVLFGVDPEKFVSDLKNYFEENENGQEFRIMFKGGSENLKFKANAKLPVGTIQPFLDEYLKENKGITIDYIHGEAEVERLCKNKKTVGILFKGMEKSDLFPAVAADGSLPRKTFSMGHSTDKRYYLEGRRIK